MKKLFPLFILLFFFGKNTFAQDTISLKNASFEWGSAVANSIPIGWQICSRPTETPPDVHTEKSRHYGVQHSPMKGDKFLGMVVRSNFTYESIHQKLKMPLQENKTYKMHLYVAMSKTFKSHDAKTMNEEFFTQPAIIRIWGVENACETKELLFESEVIDHENWKRIAFEFTPKMAHQRIMFEAFYDKMVADPYNGNVLLDGISDIIEVE